MLTQKDLLAIKSLFESRFDSIDKRFDGIDKRLDGVDKRLDGVDKRLNGLDNSIKQISSRLDANTKDLTDLILAGFSTHEPVLANHEKRIAHLEHSTFKSN